MNDFSASLRALVIYAVCLPLAIFIGYLISNPLQMSTLVTYALLAFALCLPLLLRWHRSFMLLTWNMTATIFFLPGRPSLGMVAMLFSFIVIILQRALDRNMRLANVQRMTWPLVFMVGLVLLTGKLNGGIGFKSLGSEVYGGRHYMLLLFGIMGYFALSTVPIPAEKAKLYVGLFCVGGVTSIISDLYSVLPGGMNFIFLIFPPSTESFMGGFEVGTTRLAGAAGLSTAIFLFMMSRYGIAGIFSRGVFRASIFIVGSSLGLLGGHRGFIATLGLIFMIQFFLEGLHRTKWLMRFVFVGVILSIFVIVFSSKLPFTLQRAISFLPLDLDPVAVESGQDTIAWRLRMWSGLLPQIPKYFWLGKGYALSAEDYYGTTAVGGGAEFNPSQGGLAIAGDYHNGWLSAILPFGVWGLAFVVWFFCVAGRVLMKNYRYGNPDLRIINAFLFAWFLEMVLMFWGGALHTDMLNFGALVGLSVALNHGVAQRVPETAPEPVTTPKKDMFARPAFGRFT